MELEKKFKEKIENIIDANNFLLLHHIHKLTKQCQQIAEEFAVGFAEWMVYDENKTKGEYTVKQYFQLYKQHLKENGK